MKNTQMINNQKMHPIKTGDLNVMPTGRKEIIMAHDPLEYIRSCYNVPAKKGKIVKYKDKLGMITGASGPYVKVRLDGEKSAHPYHPSDLGYNPA